MPLDDSRSASEHAVDRIMYSDAFRRLGEVTQVVAVGETPLFHTRLTHTLKVAQLARRIAQHLQRQLGGTAEDNVDAGAAEAAGLAHDLGHPPFGHIGETSLDEKCRASGLDGFEGNAQSFRILTKLTNRNSQELGLGLDARTLAAVVKYPWLRQGPHSEATKWNAYPTESAEFNRARQDYSEEVLSVEASIMDWADDITYAVHDLEDFIRAGRVPVAVLANDPVEWASFIEDAVPRVQKKVSGIDLAEVAEGLQDLLQIFYGQFLHRGTDEQLITLRQTSSWFIGSFVGPIEFVSKDQPIQVPDRVRAQVQFLQQLTWRYVIHDPALASMQEGQKRVVRTLFDRLVGWLSQAEKRAEMSRLPTRLRDLYARTSTEPGNDWYANANARRARAVADYVSSLTEAQALNLYERLTGVGQHSVSDPWLAY